MTTAPFRSVGLPEARVVHRVSGEVVYLEHPDPLEVQDADVVAMLDRCCTEHGPKRFLAERATEGWRTLTFSEFRDCVERAADALEAMHVDQGSCVAILARNGIDHAIANFAVLAAGGVVVPLSPVYLAHATGAAALRDLAQQAKAQLIVHDADIDVAGHGFHVPRVSLQEIARWATQDRQGRPLSERSHRDLTQRPAKIFFTSGSTGKPKIVVNTHRMLVSAAAALAHVSPTPPEGEQPVTVDWLPWTHVFGGNVSLHGALLRGIAMHVDAGAPIAERFEVTLRNLREIAPNEFSSVPAAYSLLIDALERDDDLAHAFFRRIRTCAFGGAALSASLVERFQRLAADVCGERIPFGGGYGMTEACGIIASVYWLTDRTDLLGLPPPGVQMKLVRVDDSRWECRIRGPNVATDRTDACDDEGYFRTGDAVQFAVEQDPTRGLVFAGRLNEEFKLANGTWVRAGKLREELLETLRPHAHDLVIAGADRDSLSALIWLRSEASVAWPQVASLCRTFNASHRGASQRIERVFICDEPLDGARGEITAKGTINMRKVAENRRALIERLYASNEHVV